MKGLSGVNTIIAITPPPARAPSPGARPGSGAGYSKPRISPEDGGRNPLYSLNPLAVASR